MNNPFTVHLLVTPLCDRNCNYCCNKQYDLNKVPYVTREELENAELVCLTGGEPFKYSDPCSIAHYLKKNFNVKKVIVYSNAYEFYCWLNQHFSPYFMDIDGVTISIKTTKDKESFEKINFDCADDFLTSNLLYVFPGFEDTKCPESFQKINRVWQTAFTSAENSIFRRL